MRAGVMGALKAEALERQVAAAERLAAHLGAGIGAVDALKAAKHRDPQVAALRQSQALTAILEQLADAAEVPEVPEVPEAVPSDGAAASASTRRGRAKE